MMIRSLPSLIVAVVVLAAGSNGPGQAISFTHQRLANRGPIVMQAGPNDCGLAALATMLTVLGRRTTLADISAGIVIQDRGLSMLALQRIAAQHSLKLEGVQDRRKRLDRWPFPWMAHWAYGVREHYVVVESANDQVATVADPAVGRVTMNVSEFVGRWSGRALILSGRYVPQVSVSEPGGVTVRLSKQIGGVL
jgi:ABC-type bacteriocin/lantibiotic exporter with double-glycine peptidase domain